MSRWRTRSCRTATAVATSVALAACGSGARQDANEPSGIFPVAVPTATFPSSQRLAEHTHLVISVRNSGNQTIPNVAVTICNVTCSYSPHTPAGEGTSAQAFAEDLNMPYLADPSRPVWIIDRPPGPCEYSCRAGGQGAAVTAYANTWALGPLKPGATATFDWGLTAVKAGTHVVAWEIAAGLNGKAKARLASGGIPRGTFRVTIQNAPQQSYVNNAGQVVKTP